CCIFTRESSAAVASIATISIHDDFAASQARISLRSANNETTSWIDEVFSIFIDPFSWNDFIDDVFFDIALDLLQRYFWVVLSRNNNRIYTKRLIVFIVFNCHLRFAIRTQIRKNFFLAHFSQAARQFMRQ